MTKATSYRLSPKARRLLAKLAAAWGLTQTAMLEVLIRLEAERKGIQNEQHDDDPKNDE